MDIKPWTLPNTRQIRSKASSLTRTRLLINIHQSQVHRCGSLSSKERVSKRMRALFTLCLIISPAASRAARKQICNVAMYVIWKGDLFSLSLKTVYELYGLKTIQNFFRNLPGRSPNKMAPLTFTPCRSIVQGFQCRKTTCSR